MISKESSRKKSRRKRHFFIIGGFWFLGGFFSRISDDIGALFTLLALITSTLILISFFKYIRREIISGKEILLSSLGIIAILVFTTALAPIGISVSEKIKPLSQQEIEAKEQKNLSTKVSSKAKPEPINPNISETPATKSAIESCKLSEFENCKIKANLVIESAYGKEAFDSSEGYLCTRHNIAFKNLMREKVTGIKGYFVLDIYFVETFSKKLESGRYILSDEYGVPFWFAHNKKLQPITLNSGDTKTFSGEYCDPLAKDLSTALLHLQGRSTESWKMEFVLEELQIEGNRTMKFNDSWVGNLCSTADLSWAIANSGTLSDCRQRTT